MLRVILLPFSYFLNFLPKVAFDGLVVALGAFLFRVIRFRTEIVAHNLLQAYSTEKTKEELEQIAQKNYDHYVRTFLELIQSIVWTRSDFLKKTQIHWTSIQEQMEKQQGGFILTSHLGNWEFAIQTVTAWGMPCDVIVKKQTGRLANQFFEWYRTRFGARLLYESTSSHDIFRSVSDKRFVVFVLDQFMGPPIGLPVKFFNLQAGTAAGLALLMEKEQVPLFVAHNYRDLAGKVQVYLDRVDQPSFESFERVTRLYKKTQWYNDVLESKIRSHPEQWIWLHRRWKAFRGTPRWTLKAELVVIFFAFLLQSCSSTQMGATSTGIEVPPDPSIAVPAFNSVDATEEVESKVPTPQAKPKKEISSTKKSPKKNLISVGIVPVDKVPFEVGERLVIDLTWLALPAGQGVLEVREGPVIQGRPTFHLWGNVLSSKMVDTIYHVDNTIESFIDQAGFIPYKFLLSMFESAQKKETRVVFDHPNQKAMYWSKRISQKWGDQDVDKADPIVAQSRDMFSALYYARALNYEINKKHSFWIYENGQNLNVELTPITREMITSGAGVFQCWKIKVDIKLNGVLRPTGDLFMWLSDDSKKYLVRFDAKIKIGSLLGRLTSIRER